MKSLYILVALFIIPMFGIAQSLKIIEPGQTNNLNGQDAEVIGTSSTPTLELPLHVINESGSSMDVRVKRYQLFAAEGTKHVACWYICPTEDYVENYPYVDLLRDDAGNILETTIAPGDTNKTFFAKHYPEGISSCAFYKYVFYDRSDEADSSTVYLRFNHGGDFCYLSDEEFQIASKELNIQLYPNPASTQLNIELEGNQNLPKEITVTNILGSTIYHNKLSKSSVNHQISLDHFENGLYFITVFQNNKAVLTKKFQVVK